MLATGNFITDDAEKNGLMTKTDWEKGKLYLTETEKFCLFAAAKNGGVAQMVRAQDS